MITSWEELTLYYPILSIPILVTAFPILDTSLPIWVGTQQGKMEPPRLTLAVLSTINMDHVHTHGLLSILMAMTIILLELGPPQLNVQS